MFGARHKLASGRISFELGNFAEVEVDRQFVVFVLEGKDEVFPVVGGSVAKLEVLFVEFDLRVAGSCHHLDLER